MRREDVTVVVVARTGSERFPNKVMQEIRGRPYISWLLDRVKVLGNVVLATTTSPCDKFLADLATAGNVAVYCGSEQDVLRRVYTAAMIYAPQRYIMVVLGDCPFIATELVAHALQNMDRFENDSFLWLLAPHIWPVYGAREFPYAFDAFQRINHCAPNREISTSIFIRTGPASTFCSMSRRIISTFGLTASSWIGLRTWSYSVRLRMGLGWTLPCRWSSISWIRIRRSPKSIGSA